MSILLSNFCNPSANQRSQCISSCKSIPVIDLCNERRQDTPKLLVKACEEYGFFKVTNHGIPAELIDGMEAEALKLFALPSCNKERAGPPDPFGYGNKSIGFNGDVGWIEYLLLRCDPDSIQQRLRRISPDNYESFCTTANKYIGAVRKLACEILGLLAEGLGLPQNSFAKFITEKESDSVFRLNHYPAHPNEFSRLMGFGEHSDPQILTVLHSNDIAGLEILLRDGKWIAVPPDAKSFAINVGDCLQALTNGRLKSVRHRAVANSQKSRISMVFFGAPALEAVIKSPLQLVDEQHPRLYRSFSWCEYKKSIYSFKLGHYLLDSFRLP